MIGACPELSAGVHISTLDYAFVTCPWPGERRCGRFLPRSPSSRPFLQSIFGGSWPGPGQNPLRDRVGAVLTRVGNRDDAWVDEPLLPG